MFDGHVFISHSTHDDPAVAELRVALEDLKLSTWDPQASAQPEAPPVAKLVLELEDLGIDTSDGQYLTL